MINVYYYTRLYIQILTNRKLLIQQISNLTSIEWNSVIFAIRAFSHQKSSKRCGWPKIPINFNHLSQDPRTPLNHSKNPRCILGLCARCILGRCARPPNRPLSDLGARNSRFWTSPTNHSLILTTSNTKLWLLA